MTNRDGLKPVSSTINRYSPDGYMTGMSAQHEGDYVLYTDHAAQVEALEAEVARLKAVETLLTPQGGYQPQSQGDNPANAPPDAE